jgi:DNA-binding CsgD family transcriptional regulator
MSVQNVGQSREHVRPWMPSRNHHIWWEAFAQYVGSSVVVTNSAGRFLFANRAAQQFLNHKQGDLVGRTWHDVLPTDVADERLAYARCVLETKRPVALIGMVKGTCRRAVFHPIDSDDPVAETLIVICHPLTALDRPPDLDRSNGAQVVIAQSNDLGSLSVLTERELEVLAHLGEGLSTAEIAKRLYRSAKTVEWHRRSLGVKLGAANRVQLARIAIRAGLSHVGLVDTRLRVGSHPIGRTDRVPRRRHDR